MTWINESRENRAMVCVHVITDLQGALWCCSHCSPTLTERTRDDKTCREEEEESICCRVTAINTAVLSQCLLIFYFDLTWLDLRNSQNNSTVPSGDLQVASPHCGKLLENATTNYLRGFSYWMKTIREEQTHLPPPLQNKTSFNRLLLAAAEINNSLLCRIQTEKTRAELEKWAFGGKVARGYTEISKRSQK